MCLPREACKALALAFAEGVVASDGANRQRVDSDLFAANAETAVCVSDGDGIGARLVYRDAISGFAGAHRYVLPATRRAKLAGHFALAEMLSPVTVQTGSGLTVTSSLQTLKRPSWSVTVTE